MATSVRPRAAGRYQVRSRSRHAVRRRDGSPDSLGKAIDAAWSVPVVRSMPCGPARRTLQGQSVLRPPMTGTVVTGDAEWSTSPVTSTHPCFRCSNTENFGAGKIRVGKSADRNGGDALPPFDPESDRRSAVRAKPVGRLAAAVCQARPFGMVAGQNHLVVGPACLSCKRTSAAFLAFEAVADRNTDGFALAGRPQLATSAGCYSLHGGPFA